MDPRRVARWIPGWPDGSPGGWPDGSQGGQMDPRRVARGGPPMGGKRVNSGSSQQPEDGLIEGAVLFGDLQVDNYGHSSSIMVPILIHSRGPGLIERL